MDKTSCNIPISRLFNHFDKVETSGVDCQCAWLAFNNALKLNGLSIKLPVRNNVLINRKQVIDKSNISMHLSEVQKANLEGLTEMDYENDFEQGNLTDMNVFLYMISYIFEQFKINTAVTVITNPVKYCRFELANVATPPIELTVYHNLVHFSNLILKDKRRFKIIIENDKTLTITRICEFLNCTSYSHVICCAKHFYFGRLCEAYPERMNTRLREIEKHNDKLMKLLEERLKADQQFQEDYLLARALSEEGEKVISAYDTIITYHTNMAENRSDRELYETISRLEQEKLMEAQRIEQDRLYAMQLIQEERSRFEIEERILQEEQQIENDRRLALEMSKDN